MMKNLLLFAIVALLTAGCTAVQRHHIEKASEVCEVNGGVARIKNQGFSLVVTCENGAQFNILAGKGK